MKKVLLIDDRSKRQKEFTADTGIKLEEYNDILDNIVGEQYLEYVNILKKQDFHLDHEIIITHRSAFGETEVNILDRLKNYCQKENKKLVFFSGGISSVFYLKEPFEFLLLNSKTLYSENLKIFLESISTNSENILQLAYGKQWTLNIMLNTLEKINLFIGYNIQEDEVYYDEFLEDTQIDLVKDCIKYIEPEVKNGYVKMQDLKVLRKKITNQIKQKVVLNV